METIQCPWNSGHYCRLFENASSSPLWWALELKWCWMIDLSYKVVFDLPRFCTNVEIVVVPTMKCFFGQRSYVSILSQNLVYKPLTGIFTFSALFCEHCVSAIDGYHLSAKSLDWVNKTYKLILKGHIQFCLLICIKGVILVQVFKLHF